jgi:hypothetical protein
LLHQDVPEAPDKGRAKVLWHCCNARAYYGLYLPSFRRGKLEASAAILASVLCLGPVPPPDPNPGSYDGSAESDSARPMGIGTAAQRSEAAAFTQTYLRRRTDLVILSPIPQCTPIQ